jgi:hypothetical protein
MSTPRLFAARLALAGLAAVAMFALSSAARAQPAEELIDKLLELSRQKTKLAVGKGDDELRKLLVERYNVAVDELKLRCEDFKRSVATKATVFEAGRHLLHADLELQTAPAEKVKVLEKTIDLARWYEKRLERALKDGLVSQADLLRVKYSRLTLEIDLVKTKKSAAEAPPK